MNQINSQRTWWEQNMKWFVPLAGVLILITGFFIHWTFGNVFNNFAQAYAEDELVEKAVAQVRENERVQQVLGEIAPVDKMAIFNGAVKYSNDNNSVDLTIKIKGAKTNAMLDISAERAGESWNYELIQVRVKNPPEKKQTIKITGAGED
ncbi:cytochrome c oxidase assembly factor Coa1 family protein [Salinimicrobium sp. GXAS 041]|uniref:cytochrome c oxidase assembly factor Coa1 family protein n=1 Tax=Salinimicrobium sp. GXAS 041 TaxID=3400806 RepID=UPI003C72DBC1